MGTARPDEAQMRGIPHALMGDCSVRAPLNAASFCARALPLITSLHRRRQIPVLVGGSAFYLRALAKGMYASGTSKSGPLERPCEGLQDGLKCEQLLRQARQYLREHDPASWRHIHPNDAYRTLRAVEYHRQTGRPLSEERRKFQNLGAYDFSRPQNPAWRFVTLYLDIPKEEHWRIIRRRAGRMLERGLVEELEGLLCGGLSGGERPLQSVGYRETLDYLRGNIGSRGELEEKIFISTRQLAKSQRTFFKKIHPKKELNPLVEREAVLNGVADQMAAWAWP